MIYIASCMWYSHINVTLGAIIYIGREFYCLVLGILKLFLGMGIWVFGIWAFSMGVWVATWENWMFCVGHWGIVNMSIFGLFKLHWRTPKNSQLYCLLLSAAKCICFILEHTSKLCYCMHSLIGERGVPGSYWQCDSSWSSCTCNEPKQYTIFNKVHGALTSTYPLHNFKLVRL